jgi:hypothetical protein
MLGYNEQNHGYHHMWVWLYRGFPIPVRSPEGGAPKVVSPKVFPNLRRMHKYRNQPLSKQLSFDFLRSFPCCGKEIFPWERGNIKIGELPEHKYIIKTYIQKFGM